MNNFLGVNRTRCHIIQPGRIVFNMIAGLLLSSLAALPTWASPDFNSLHYCFNNPNDPVCTIISRVKTVVHTGSHDIQLVAHRGIWGTAAGSGPPENSQAAFQLAIDRGYDVLEIDVGATAQEYPGDESSRGVAGIHDYWLGRLTTNEGYAGETLLAEITQLKLRRRDLSLSDETVMSFREYVQFIKTKNVFSTVDIKELRSDKREADGEQCTLLCDYQTHEEREASWIAIAKKCIAIAEEEGTLHQLAFKPRRIAVSALRAELGDDFDKVLWMPVLIDSDFETTELAFEGANEWAAVKESVLSVEIVFKDRDSLVLQNHYHPEGGMDEYAGVGDYIKTKHNMRPATFIQEVPGRKGDVDRWGFWHMPDRDSDFRGDHLELVSLPAFRFFQLTTDRPEVWNAIFPPNNNSPGHSILLLKSGGLQ